MKTSARDVILTGDGGVIPLGQADEDARDGCSAGNQRGKGRRTCARASGPILAAHPAAVVILVNRIVSLLAIVSSSGKSPGNPKGHTSVTDVPTYTATTPMGPSMVDAAVSGDWGQASGRAAGDRPWRVRRFPALPPPETQTG